MCQQGETESRGRIGGSNGRHILRSPAVCEDRGGCSAGPGARDAQRTTFFPLSLNKVLILTNLSWVRNPYQNEQKLRPNPGYFRNTIFNFLSIQIGRKLTEDEVLQINYITKRRANRYIAAAEREWLYPEQRVSTDHWKKLGDGYLLMPAFQSRIKRRVAYQPVIDRRRNKRPFLG